MISVATKQPNAKGIKMANGHEHEPVSAKVTRRLQTMGVGNVSTLWDLLVYRVSQDRWVVGHQTVNVKHATGLKIEEAVERFVGLLD